MNQISKSPLQRAIEIAGRDRISPIPCTRRDTGEVIWLVQSRSDPSHHRTCAAEAPRLQTGEEAAPSFPGFN